MRTPEPKKKKATTKICLRERFDRFLHRWQSFKGYPTLIAILVTFLIYVAVRTFGVEDDPAQLRFVETTADQIGERIQADDQHLKPVFSGEAYDSAQRMRECGAMLMAVFLSAFEQFQTHGRFPATVDPILTDLQKRSLLPPGVEINGGVLRSSLSELKLNYRSDPFSFEILSFPTKGTQGPGLLFRFPLPPGEANSIMYFQTSSGTTARIPAPFGSPEQLAAAGWSISYWRGDALPLDDSALRDLHEQDTWLKSIHQGGR